jgi:predicted dehydrogenase
MAGPQSSPNGATAESSPTGATVGSSPAGASRPGDHAPGGGEAAGRLGWGVLGAAGIALNKVIPGMLKSPRLRLVALASRDAGKAAAAAARFGIPTAYGSYEALLADPAVEAVYNPLPNHLHVPWTLKALAAGKHVLCEKPIALTADEAAQLIEAERATGRRVLEAFMVRQHPQWLAARDVVRSGRLGDVRLVQTTLSFFNVDPTNVRNRPDAGGGALLDIGCYGIVLGRFVFGAEPERAVAAIDRDPALGTDRLTSAIVDFGRGRHLVFSASTQLSRGQRVQIYGSAGRLEVPVSLNAPQGGETVIRVDASGDLDGSGIETIRLPACDQYTLQAEMATAAFRGEIAAPFPLADAVANMAVVDAIVRSAASGRWEPVARRA